MDWQVSHYVPRWSRFPHFFPNPRIRGVTSDASVIAPPSHFAGMRSTLMNDIANAAAYGTD